MPLKPTLSWSSRLSPAWIAVPACLIGMMTAHAQTIDPSRLGEAGSLPYRGTFATDEEEMQRRDLGEENGFATRSRADDDIGQQLILKETPKNRPWRAMLDEFLLWSNNAANVASGEVSDWMWGQRIGIGWQQRIASHWFADLSLTQGMYRYERSNALDFQAMEAMATILDVEPRLWNVVFVGSFGFTRITNNEFQDSLLNSLSGRFGAQRLITFDRRNSLQLALSGDWDLTNDVDQVFRDEYSFDLAYKYKIMRDLSLSLAYRMTYFNYRKVDRADLLHVVGATLTYTPKEWMEIYATASYALNESDISFFDYETVSGGAGLGMKVKF
ncbi:MAG TPA: outer membrane beta-barrel protein [Prosthecobacter sp.]|nr:outer membrane beta-barrel protein [Prosthecobacter sp.]HRK15649.1 outer membrane beta-barrel protein [Prosthecobacter sp.]